MLSFKFGGKDSFTDFGVYIEQRPKVPTPKRRVEFISVSGRSGSLKYDDKTYEDITIAIECGIISNGNAEGIYSRLDDLKEWLFESGEQQLIFSFSTNRYYIAQVVNQIDFEIALRKIGKFVIVFNCKPFQYSVNNNAITLTKSDTNIINMGNLESPPIIEVYGSGDITLGVNENFVNLLNVSSQITMNSVIKDAYNDKLENLNSKMDGDFLMLSKGTNNITWSGNVSKVIVTPNWRWL